MTTRAQYHAKLHNEYERGFKDGVNHAKIEFAKAQKTPDAREAQVKLITAVGQMLHGLAASLDNGPR